MSWVVPETQFAVHVSPLWTAYPTAFRCKLLQVAQVKFTNPLEGVLLRSQKMHYATSRMVTDSISDEDPCRIRYEESSKGLKMADTQNDGNLTKFLEPII